MSSSNSSARFVDDKRGVSAVIGFILIFGILVLALTTYQAAIVPQQNAQTEFQHFEDNRDELIEFRNAVSTAGQNRVSQFPNIKLGTQYQSRTFTINPAPPAGTLQTSEPYNITLTDGETTKNVSTRFVEYRPGYREISVGSTWYEHSVLYLDERESSGQNIIEDQNIVTSSGTVRITALQNEYRSSGTERVSVELYPTDDSEFPEFDGEVTVKIPTRLDGEDYWDEELDGRSVYNNVESYPDEDDVYRVVLEVDSDDDVEMNTVGIQDEPTEDSVNNVPDRGSGDDEGTEVNPAGPNDVRLVGVNKEGGGTVVLTFRNNGEDTKIDSGRVGFYTGSGENNPREVTISVPNEADTRAIWTIGEGFRPLDPPIMLSGGEDTEVEYDFDQNYNTNQDFFITTLDFDNDKRGTYFVGGEYDPDDGDNGNGENEQVSLDEESVDTINGNDGFTFVLNNNGDNTVTITEIRFTESDLSDFIEDQDDEGGTFRDDGTTSFYDGRIDSPSDLDNNAEIDADSSLTFEIGQFRTEDGSSGTINTNNEDATIVLTFENGSTKQIQLN